MMYRDKKSQAILETAITFVMLLLLFAGILSLWRKLGNNYMLRLNDYKQNRVSEINGSVDAYGKYIQKKGDYNVIDFY